MNIVAAITLKLPGHISLDDIDNVVDKVRELALPVLSGDKRSILIEWSEPVESVPDEGSKFTGHWFLRGQAEDTKEEVESMGLDVWFPDLDEPGVVTFFPRAS